jgi:hypothetical protein
MSYLPYMRVILKDEQVWSCLGGRVSPNSIPLRKIDKSPFCDTISMLNTPTPWKKDKYNFKILIELDTS